MNPGYLSSPGGIRTGPQWAPRVLWLLVLFTCTSPSLRGQELLDFNRDIRPILAENCFFCHGQDANKRQADLRLDLRDNAIEFGAITPGDPQESTLVERILAGEDDGVMPPTQSNRHLSAEQKLLLQQWVEQGARYQKHWAYVTPVRPDPPPVENRKWVRNEIDRFVLARLEAEGLSPSPVANRMTLIRRLSIDLTGLPPTPEQVDMFVADSDPAAYEKLVDRLLDDPHYGERMALPWIEAARYSDSNGFQQDGDTWQWIWRDWVVRALNEDLPFDQFTIWQLAGDLLPDATIDQKIASGFNRNHMLNGEGGAIAEEQRFVNLFDRIDTTATTWLGLTMACAQCHDHKYDPVTQRDYYSLMDAFNRLPESGVPQRQSARIRVAAPFIEIPTEANQKQLAEYRTQIEEAEVRAQSAVDAAWVGWREGIFGDGNPADTRELPQPLIDILARSADERTEDQKKELESELRKHFDAKIRGRLVSKIPLLGKTDQLKKQLAAYRGDQIPRVMVMSDAKPRETNILERGEYLNRGEAVSFATPAFLPPLPRDAAANRLGLAQWLVAPSNPLTARVQINRMWQYFFGTGIVKTTEDLGVQSEYPIHKELLDWLAVEFVEDGWSSKRMHRLIVTSATYRQSSRMTERHRTRDPENRLLSRASRFRMPAMILRDWALASSGLLVDQIGGAPVYPYQPDNVWEPLAITKERDFTYPASSGADLYRRSLYTFWRRTVAPANMFDASNRQACRVRFGTTSTPLHALTTLNDPTWVEAARVLAQYCMWYQSTTDQRLEMAFRRILCRPPTPGEQQRLTRSFERQRILYEDDPDSATMLLAVGQAQRDTSLNPSDHAALTVVCLGILNLDEALNRE